MKVLLLGGGGALGRTLQPLLERHEVRVASRRAEKPVDLATGEGLHEAVRWSEVVVHLASDPRKPREIDVDGTRRLLAAIDGQHVVYMSIVGVDRHPFPYYRAKFEAENLIRDSGTGHTIIRATQFHSFLTFLLERVCRRWMAFVPAGFVFQPIAIEEVAAALANLVHPEPAGLLPDVAGPEVLTADHLARTYMEARGREAPLFRFPVPGNSGRAFRKGVHTNSDRAVGKRPGRTTSPEWNEPEVGLASKA